MAIVWAVAFSESFIKESGKASEPPKAQAAKASRAIKEKRDIKGKNKKTRALRHNPRWNKSRKSKRTGCRPF
jgi:hypothetical protein